MPVPARLIDVEITVHGIAVTVGLPEAARDAATKLALVVANRKTREVRAKIEVTAQPGESDKTFNIPLGVFRWIRRSDIRSHYYDLEIEAADAASRLAVPAHLIPKSLWHNGREIALVRNSSGEASFRSSFRTGLRPRPKWSLLASLLRTRPLRVMLFVSQINLGGGKTKAVFKIAEQLRSKGHRVCIAALYYGDNSSKHAFPKKVAFDFADGSYKSTPAEGFPPSDLLTVSRHAGPFTAERLSKLLAASDYDVIYLPSHDGMLYRTFFDSVPAHTAVVLGDHNPRRLDQIETDKGLNPFFDQAARRADAVHVVNPLLLDGIRKRTGADVFFIPNTAEAKKPIRRDEAFFATRKLIAIGRLVSTKRMNHAIAAFAKVAADFPEWTLEIFGSGDLQQKLEEQVEKLAMADRIFLKGFDPAVTQRLADGAVYLTSTAAEALPLTMIEAMEASCLIVSYDGHMGARYLIEHEKNGLLARDGDINSLAAVTARAMKMVEERDPAVLSMLAAGLERLPEFEDARIADAWDRRMRSVVARKRRS
jgi:glycosyltransferase involved in cell wall biosynthesis